MKKNMGEKPTTFIDKGEKLPLLNEALDKASKGNGCIILIEGIAGIGKSRLIAEFRSTVEQNKYPQALVAYTEREFEKRNDIPFAPLIDLFTYILEDYSSNRSKRAYKKILLYFTKHLPFVRDIISMFPGAGSIGTAMSLVHTLLSGKLDKMEKEEHPFEQNTTQTQLFSAGTTLLKRLSEDYRPLVLIIDNLHWIDDSTMNFLSYLAHEIESSPILVVLAYRPDDILNQGSLWGIVSEHLASQENLKLGRVKQISLNYFTEKQVREFIKDFYTFPKVDEGFVHAIYMKTGGNPLFIEQLLLLLQECSEITKTNQQQLTLRKLSYKQFPEKVQDVLHQRIHNIEDKTDLKLHDYASVIGENFYSELLLKLSCGFDDEISLVGQLGTDAKNYRMIEENRNKSFGDYHFKHALIHQAFYNRMMQPERNKSRIMLHAKIGGLLEAKYSEEGQDKNAPLLAYHFMQGQSPAKEFEYRKAAGKYAQSVNAHTDAVRHYQRSLDLMETNAEFLSRENETFEKDRVDILLNLGASYEILGQRQRSLEIFERACDSISNFEDRLLEASALTNLGISWFHLGRFDESEKALKSALAIYEPIENSLHGRELRAYGACLNWNGINHRNRKDMGVAMTLHNRALDVARKAGDRQLEAHVIANIGAIYLWKKEFAKVIDEWEQSLKISKAIRDKPRIAHYLIDVGYMSLLNGQNDEAFKYLMEGIKLAQEGYFQENIARGLMNLGSLFFVEGDLPKAEETYLKALDVAKKHHVAKLIWRLQHNLGNIYQKHGNNDRAAKYYQQSIGNLISMMETYPTIKERQGFIEHRLNPFRSMILLYLKKGDMDDAQKYTGAHIHPLLTEFLENRVKGITLDEEERKNKNYFAGYYVDTE